MLIKDLARLIPYLSSLRWRYAGGALFLLLTNAFALLIPWFMKLAVEALQHPQSARFSPTTCALGIALLAAMHCITRIFSRTLILNAARIIEFRIRNDLFQHLTRLDIGYFSSSRSGDILSRFSNDLTNVRMLAGFGAMSIINTLLVYSAAVTLMIRIHPWLTFWAIFPFPLMVLVVKKVSHRLFQRSLQAQEELAHLSSQAEETVSAVRLIKSYCREEYFQNEFAKTAGRYLKQNLRLARLRGIIIPVMAIATGSGTLIVLFMGGRLVIEGIITLGDFVAFSGYLAMLVWPTAVLGWILTLAQRGAASMSRLSAILGAKATVVDHPDARDINALQNKIEARDLRFSYGGANVISGVSFHVQAGESVGITGEVGCGKTTILRLIARLLPVTEGMLFVDGRDINTISRASLRKLIGYVPQETFLFSRTVADNISYGISGELVTDTIRNAAAQAGFLNDVESFPDKFETPVGEGGVTLSGGQKQRLAIARAVAGDPQILLFDDPLSAVDAGREEEILNELGKFYSGRTVLIVSQRISAFRDCQRILVLKSGVIVEQGTPTDLIQRGGLYAEICRKQQQDRDVVGE
ncbi:MAG: ABC transporter ATP-binding protein [Desulfuromonadaceae bacterium]|nr:ABC transporter ATP-binding protein [Desulfuromonadaceae bacterium]MDD2848149.1 ABC transporter ATP-binding protein [Desulfuromonadaceae bacterium]MDD4132010.1 ABC transporter ATP-binding protein [Desulfuromonadaceae bacterium]